MELLFVSNLLLLLHNLNACWYFHTFQQSVSLKILEYNTNDKYKILTNAFHAKFECDSKKESVLLL